jgi:hypothetical protein
MLIVFQNWECLASLVLEVQCLEWASEEDVRDMGARYGCMLSPPWLLPGSPALPTGSTRWSQRLGSLR